MKRILFLGSMAVLLILGSCKKDNHLVLTDELNGDGTFEYAGRIYTYKMIMGNVGWMIENLAYLPSVSPSSAGSETTPAYYVYGYEGTSVIAAKATENYKKYGVLYNLEAAKTACPPGWHLPTDNEWRYLCDFGLGTYVPEDTWIWGCVSDDSLGFYLKSTTGWLDNGNGNNSIGFTAIPTGYRDNSQGFRLLGSYTGFWSSTTDPMNWGWVWSLSSLLDCVSHSCDQPNLAFSVRCIENWQ